MLLKVKTLAKIKSGEVTQAFRKWKRPTVKEGGTLVTIIGVLDILSIEIIELADITENDLEKAGISDFDSFKKIIENKKEGKLYKILFKLGGPDPRIALRNKSELTKQEIDHLLKKLKKMDSMSKYGPWTEKVLFALRKFPGIRAAIIAEELNMDKTWLKPQIRKLKALGLTISHEKGYELSPRGTAFLNKI